MRPVNLVAIAKIQVVGFQPGDRRALVAIQGFSRLERLLEIIKGHKP